MESDTWHHAMIHHEHSTVSQSDTKGGSELVLGLDGNALVSAAGRQAETQPCEYSVGQSKFYVSTARETQETRQGGETFKMDSTPYPVEEDSLGASVNSENATMIMQQVRQLVSIATQWYRKNVANCRA